MTHHPLSTEETLRKRISREKQARLQAEDLLETKSLELYHVNQSLSVAAQKAKNHVARLNAIMNAIPDAVIVTDCHYVIQDANHKALDFLNSDHRSLIGQDLLSFLHPNHHENYSMLSASLDHKAVHTAIPKAAEIDLSLTDGRTVPTEVTLSTFHHNDDIFILHYLHDISHRRDLEAEKLKMQQERAQAVKWEAIGQLAGGIAHEINTPSQYIGDNLAFLIDSFPQISTLLNAAKNMQVALDTHQSPAAALSAFHQAAQSYDLDFLLEEMPLALQQSRDGIAQIAHIVLAMKRFSHPSSNQKTDIDLHQALETTLTVSQSEWKDVATIHKVFDPKMCLIPAHASGLNQVFLNLIVNAAHAIKDHTPMGQGAITITTQKQDDAVIISLQDTGGGIPEEHQTHIFNPFFTTKDVGKGTGQGLAIAHDIIINKHQGSLHFESTQGQGTTFYITLPLS